jgi:hypothetical protein
MNAHDQVSLGDGFLLTFLASVPLWATAAFPYTSRPVKNICLGVSAMVVLNWVLVPAARWAFKRLRAGLLAGDSRALVPARYPRGR